MVEIQNKKSERWGALKGKESNRGSENYLVVEEN
jgi:hypothetical protein